MLEKQTMSPKKPGHGHKGVVDVVLGAQWGDEGKGKLVRVSQSVSQPVRSARGLFCLCACLCACVCERGKGSQVGEKIPRGSCVCVDKRVVICFFFVFFCASGESYFSLLAILRCVFVGFVGERGGGGGEGVERTRVRICICT